MLAGLYKLGTDHAGVDKFTEITAGTRMFDGYFDHLAAHHSRALGRASNAQK
jgi:hypothetical protein